MEMPKITLKAARVNAGLSQEEAAVKLGINRATLHSYEIGKTTPDWDMIVEMESIYGYPASLIIFAK